MVDVRSLKSLFEWYNLVYTLPFGLAVLLMIISALGLGGHDHDLDHDFDHDADLDHDFDHDADLDHDFDHDADLDHDLDHDADLAHDADLDHDVDHDVEQEMETGRPSSETTVHSASGPGAEHDTPVLHALLSLLGVGKVPVTVLVQSFLVSWAVIGWNMNIWLAKVMRTPETFILPSVGVSFCGALVSMRLLASLFHKVMPSSETYAKRPVDLLSATGAAVFKIDRNGGYADVYDETGTLHRVRCRSRFGVLPGGSRVMLVDYHSDGTYEVRPVNEHGRPTASSGGTTDAVRAPVAAAQKQESESET